MNLSTWLRDRIIGPPVVETQVMVEAAQAGTEKLAEATEHLTNKLNGIKENRKAHVRREELSAILDDVLKTSQKDAPR